MFELVVVFVAGVCWQCLLLVFAAGVAILSFSLTFQGEGGRDGVFLWIMILLGFFVVVFLSFCIYYTHSLPLGTCSVLLYLSCLRCSLVSSDSFFFKYKFDDSDVIM